MKENIICILQTIGVSACCGLFWYFALIQFLPQKIQLPIFSTLLAFILIVLFSLWLKDGIFKVKTY